MLPSSQTTVVHPHQTAMAEGVAVVITEGAFGGCADVGEDERGGGLGGYPLKIDAIPRWGGRGKDTGLGAKFGVGVVSNAKSVTCWGSQYVSKRRDGREYEPLWGLLMSSRKRESNDCVRIECDGSRISFESKISSDPL